MPRIAHEKKLLKCADVDVDSTTLEANAAIDAIVRKETGEHWKASNEERESPVAPDARMFKMKDGLSSLA